MLKHGLIACSYIVLAVAVALVLPVLAPEVTPAVGAVAGGVTLVAGALAHEAWARVEGVELNESRLFRLRGVLDHVRTENLRFGCIIAALTGGGEPRKTTDLDRVVSEVRVLQKLIEQLSPSGTSGRPRKATARSDEGVSGTDDPEDRHILDIVREGLKHDRVDLYLQPIVALPERKARFYECFSRIRAADGSLVRPEQYIAVAAREGLVGAIDNLLLFRCVQLVRRAQKADENVGFFCNISASTLKDRAFFSDFVDVMAANTGLAHNLIFEFSQGDVESSRAEMEEYIFRLGRLGFSFSIDRVHDLTRLDIPALAKRRFRYIKIDGAQMLQRKAVADGRVEARGGDGTATIEINVAALKRVLQAYRMELIAEKIESEDDLAELLGYGIDYGQGYLFGVPSPSRDA